MSTQKQIFSLIASLTGQSNILTIPRLFLQMTGNDHTSALLLSQCIYWADKTKDPDGWFYKTEDDWNEELGLSYYQVKRATKILRDVLQTKVACTNGDNITRTHYRIDISKLTDWMLEVTAHDQDQQTGQSKANLRNFNSRTKANSKNFNSQIEETSDSLNESETTALDLKHGQASAPDRVHSKPPRTADEARARTLAALQAHEEKRANGALDFSWLSEDLRPLASAFCQNAGVTYYPTKKEHSLWIKVLQMWRDTGITSEIVKMTIERMRKDELTIAGPQSITNTARDTIAKKATSPRGNIPPVFRSNGNG